MKPSQRTTKPAAKASRNPKTSTKESTAKKGISWSLIDRLGSPETPDWLEDTPDLYTSYELSLYSDGEEIQRIEVTRKEFIALKEHLASLRGLNRKTAA